MKEALDKNVKLFNLCTCILIFFPLHNINYLGRVSIEMLQSAILPVKVFFLHMEPLKFQILVIQLKTHYNAWGFFSEQK